MCVRCLILLQDITPAKLRRLRGPHHLLHIINNLCLHCCACRTSRRPSCATCGHCRACRTSPAPAHHQQSVLALLRLQDITPAKLRHLRALPGLQDLTLGCTSSTICACNIALQDITPAKLRHLRALPGLQDLTLGCHHRLIASTITDACIAELVVLTSLSSLNLSQCVHVGDGGEQRAAISAIAESGLLVALQGVVGGLWQYRRLLCCCLHSAPHHLRCAGRLDSMFSQAAYRCHSCSSGV